MCIRDRHWRQLKGKGKRSGYLFVKSSGEHLTLRAVNHIIETVRKKIPGVPPWFHTHTIRRTFNHRLSLLIDHKRAEGFDISHEEERKMRNRMNGWASNSRMGEIYNARHLREKADRLAELALNTIWDPCVWSGEPKISGNFWTLSLIHISEPTRPY